MFETITRGQAQAYRPDLIPFGFALGNYMCRCARCTASFQGDKRCIRCEACAEARLVEYNAVQAAKASGEVMRGARAD